MKNSGIAIVSLVGGMIIGSALTMLFTPQSGAETRGQLKDFLDKELEKIRCKCDEKGNCECDK